MSLGFKSNLNKAQRDDDDEELLSSFVQLGKFMTYIYTFIYIAYCFCDMFNVGMGSLDVTKVKLSKQYLPLFIGWASALKYMKREARRRAIQLNKARAQKLQNYDIA